MLAENLNRFLKQSSTLDQDFKRATSDPNLDIRTMQHSVQMMTVVLQDSWSQFVRGLIVSSASGKAVSTNGSNIVGFHTLGSVTKVEQWLAANCAQSRGPEWHVTAISLGWAAKLKIPNKSDVISALGSTNSPETELRTYRNFIVHRCRLTAKKAHLNASLRAYAYEDLQEIPILHVTGGKRVFEDWVRRFQLVASVASKT